MPVELPSSQQDTSSPQPPRPLVWLAISTIVMLVGAVLTLATWPNGEPTRTVDFWLRVLVFPALACGMLYGLRLLYFEQEVERMQAEDDAEAKVRAEAIRFAQEPLAVLDYAYRCAMGSHDTSVEIAKGTTVLTARETVSEVPGIRHTALDIEVGRSLEERYHACFAALIGRVGRSVSELPKQVPLEVFLQLPSDIAHDAAQQTWQQCWSEAGLPPITPKFLTLDHGVMVLDDWLDVRGGPALEKFGLFVAVQLHDEPLPDSAEAAVALLLGWAPLAQRKKLTPQAMLHRPVTTAHGVVSDRVLLALLWGRATAGEVHDFWQADISSSGQAALLQVASEHSLGITETGDLSGLHDVDAAIGNPRAAAAWLAIALATEHACQTEFPQFICSGQNSIQMAVIQPPTKTEDVGQEHE